MTDEVLRLFEGSPLLAQDGTLPVEEAERLSGVTIETVLRSAARGEVALFARVGPTGGFLVARDALEIDDPVLGRCAGLVIRGPNQMPQSAIRTKQGGVLALDDSPEIASEILASDSASVALISFEAPGRPGWLFVPDRPVSVYPSKFEVSAASVEALRQRIAKTIPAERIDRARALREATVHAGAGAGGKMAARSFSQAVDAYCRSPDGLPGSLASLHEQGQRKKGLLLFSDFMGDMFLSEIDGDTLRRFRDGPLKQLPAHANRLPKHLRRGTMKDTLVALREDGREWPTMTAAMQREPMLWLFRLFEWLHDKAEGGAWRRFSGFSLAWHRSRPQLPERPFTASIRLKCRPNSQPSPLQCLNLARRSCGRSRAPATRPQN